MHFFQITCVSVCTTVTVFCRILVFLVFLTAYSDRQFVNFLHLRIKVSWKSPFPEVMIKLELLQHNKPLLQAILLSQLFVAKCVGAQPASATE